MELIQESYDSLQGLNSYPYLVTLMKFKSYEKLRDF